MKIVVFGPEKRTGVLRDDKVVDISYAFSKYLRERQNERHPRTLADALVPSDLARFVDGGKTTIENAQKAIDHLFGGVQNQLGPRGEQLIFAANAVKLHAPRPNNARVACAGGNFADHAMAMMARTQPAGAPKPTMEQARENVRKNGIWGFWKIHRDLVGQDGEIIYPGKTDRLDYEGEIAIILAKTGKDIKPNEIKDYVWGVTMLGDWSIRRYAEPNMPLKFAMVKNFDTSCSLGPCIAVGEGDALDTVVETYVNGERRQRHSTKEMVFSFGEYLEYLSRDLTLYSGDIVSGGTGAGTAADSSPPGPNGEQTNDRFLKPGDTVEMRSPDIGVLRAKIVAKPAAR